MIDRLDAIVLHASAVPADERARFADRMAAKLPAGSVLLQTCHRVELYHAGEELPLSDAALPAGAARYDGREAGRHLVRVAVGLESAVVAEDQVLHQLRRAMSEARARAPLAPSLDRLFDIALRSGRRARTWLPPSSRGLAELAVRRVLGTRDSPGGPVLVVGAGEMGHRAAKALARRGAELLVSSRTPERAATLATEMRATVVPFDPGAGTAASVAGVVIALAGRWPVAPATLAALDGGGAWVIDLSAPSAVDRSAATRLRSRLTTIDDLAATDGAPLSDRLMRRLDDLVEGSVDEWLRWSTRSGQRTTARALAERASEAQSAELVALWRRIPDLDPEQRAEVERMARHLAERLLRDPLEQLAEDGDGRHAHAARELFRL